MTMLRFQRYIHLTLGAALLAGCAGENGRYPSLAIRPGERVTGTFEPSAPASPAAPAPVASADLVTRLAQLEEQAKVAHAGFVTATPRAAALAGKASGSALGSESWADAAVALGELDSARSNAAITLGDLDLLYADATMAKDARAEIEATRKTVLSLLMEEDRTLADLRGKVSS